MIDRSKFQKRVTGVFTGHEFTIVRFRLRDYIEELGALPVAIDANVTAQLEALGEHFRSRSADPETERKTLRFFMSRVIPTEDTPGVWMGEESECPPTHVPISWLGQDVDFLVNQIWLFSFETPGLKTDIFFSRADTGSAGSGGEEVRPEAVEPSSAKDVPDGDEPPRV